MTRETVDAKAARLLLAGRVQVELVERGRARIAVAGDTGAHLVERDEAGWSCSCPARGRCSHLIAASLVVALVSEAA